MAPRDKSADQWLGTGNTVDTCVAPSNAPAIPRMLPLIIHLNLNTILAPSGEGQSGYR